MWTKLCAVLTERLLQSPRSRLLDDPSFPAPIDTSDDVDVNKPVDSPALHVLVPIHSRRITKCQTVTSAMLSKYPPVTFIKSRSSETESHSSEEDDSRSPDREWIEGVLSFLSNSTRVHDDDLVLVNSGGSLFFQLARNILVDRFYETLREHNKRLRWLYGTKGKSGQKFTQRVLFAATKDCALNITHDPLCFGVPPSTLEPDKYGFKTDLVPELRRPRWLEADVVMGKVADVRRLYEGVLKGLVLYDTLGIEANASAMLTEMYGNQEIARELERRRTSNRFIEWLRGVIGISLATNITDVDTPADVARSFRDGSDGPRVFPHEYGIGLDYTWRLFFTTKLSASDLVQLRYRDVEKAASVQMWHGVARPVRLTLPTDIERKSPNPFKSSNSTYESISLFWGPPLESLDALPPASNFSWNDLPLITNVVTGNVPPVLHIPPDQKEVSLWRGLWFQGWARALVRAAERENAVVAQMHDGHPLEFADLCGKHAEALFQDGRGVWGKEEESEVAMTQPVYDQFGTLIAGNGPEVLPGSEKKEDEDRWYRMYD